MSWYDPGERPEPLLRTTRRGEGPFLMGLSGIDTKRDVPSWSLEGKRTDKKPAQLRALDTPHQRAGARQYGKREQPQKPPLDPKLVEELREALGGFA